MKTTLMGEVYDYEQCGRKLDFFVFQNEEKNYIRQIV
jgi:hypothetical protein